ncbi:MAG: serine/threonine-protein kinase, partial [Myxococcota bacterium]
MSDVCPQCNSPLSPEALFCGKCGTPLYDGDAPERFLNTTIAEKFLVQEIVGVGSMGVVYLAEQLSLNKLVALKVLKQALVYDQEALKRFHFEARAASLLDHPNTISIIDFGQCDDGSPFIAMEYIDGQDLARVVADEFPLAPTRIIHIMKQVCSALDEAHAAGIIHRDLKLANIMISQRRTGEEFVKVLDFGIAKMADPMQSDGAAMTREGLIAGTPSFMSP